MRYALIALAACGIAAGTVAEAQYYPPPGDYYNNGYDGPPPRYYRRQPPSYYGPSPGYYYNPGDSRYPTGAPVRVGRGDPGQEPWRPRIDPRNGGAYCVQAGFTVQDGVCKPGRRY